MTPEGLAIRAPYRGLSTSQIPALLGDTNGAIHLRIYDALDQGKVLRRPYPTDSPAENDSSKMPHYFFVFSLYDGVLLLGVRQPQFMLNLQLAQQLVIMPVTNCVPRSERIVIGVPYLQTWLNSARVHGRAEVSLIGYNSPINRVKHSITTSM